MGLGEPGRGHPTEQGSGATVPLQQELPGGVQTLAALDKSHFIHLLMAFVATVIPDTHG